MNMVLPSRYVKKTHIKDGGFGSVYKYFDSSLERSVAIKSVSKSSCTPEVESEIDIIKKVRSKYVVEIYDYIDSPEHYLIVQEYLPGKELQELSNQVDSDYFLKIGYQAFYGLADIHNCNICHRDIKPSNMKFDEFNVLKIFDFGISRIGDVHHSVNCRGTLRYAPPEMFKQAAPSGPRLSYSADVWSMAVSLWAVLNGREASFNGVHSSTGPCQASFTNISLASELETALEECTHPEPSLRPSAERMSELFRRSLTANKHIGRLISGRSEHVVSKANTTVKVTKNNSSFVIEYNGLDFIIRDVVGIVHCNNVLLDEPLILPFACVITMTINNRKMFISFASSSPEVTI